MHHQTQALRRVAGRLAAASALAIATVVPAMPALAATDDATAPVVVETGEGPTGYGVTFRFDAPDANQVSLVGDVYFTQPGNLMLDFSHDARLGDEWQEGDISHPVFSQTPAPMSKNADGVWELTTAMPSGRYNYGFVVGDCPLAFACSSSYDPANPPVFSDAEGASAQPYSQVFVPESSEFPTYGAGVQGPVVDPSQAGTVEHVLYESAHSLNPDGRHQLGVYLPAGYDADRDEPYPLLVLSHGAYDNETSWFSQGGAQHILDHAIADGAIPPAAVVTTHFNDLEPGGITDPDLLETYSPELIESVLPFVESEHHVSTHPDERAFGGLSMGGGLGVNLLHKHPDLFAYFGLWSAAADLDGQTVVAPTAEQLEGMETVTEIHVGAGLQDALGGIGDKSVERATLYAELGLPVTEHHIDGGHTWQVRRQELDHFLRTAAVSEVEAPQEQAAPSVSPSPAEAADRDAPRAVGGDARGPADWVGMAAAILVSGALVGAVAVRLRRKS